jgi:uncharacterized protein (TIGR00255 family)
MVKSMTGFGKGDSANQDVTLAVEIKSVNHRYCDINIKLPRSLSAFENEVKKTVGQKLKRGKVDVYINMNLIGSSAMRATLNRPLVSAYLAALDELKNEFSVSGDISLDWLASQKDLIQIEEATIDPEIMKEVLITAVQKALAGHDQMRIAEGAATADDMLARLGQISGLLDQIETLAPEVPKEWLVKLEQRLKKFSEEIEFDPQRLAQELAIVADRCDVSEELTRFHSHIQQFEALLNCEEPVGRKMDFLVQEMNREANTTGSKSNHADMTRLVVEIKAELEKIREQVQNVE